MDVPYALGGGGGLAVGRILTVPEGDINSPPRPPKLIIGGCTIGGMPAPTALNPYCRQTESEGMATPLAVAHSQLWIHTYRCLPHSRDSAGPSSSPRFLIRSPPVPNGRAAAPALLEERHLVGRFR